MAERLQKVLSRCGVASRREAEEIIKAGRVAVNGKTVTLLGTKVEPGRDTITVDGRPVRAERFVYILLNKPRGVVTTLSDPRGRRTVADLIPGVMERVYPVGRLDYNTDGLILLTNDGDLAYALTHPSCGIEKTYRAVVEGIPSEAALETLRQGVLLDDGPTAPAKVVLLEKDTEARRALIEITISEGRNRQVRRMCEAVGHPVLRLKRTRIAFLTLDGIKRGAFRRLSPSEVDTLKALVPGPAAPGKKGGAGVKDPGKAKISRQTAKLPAAGPVGKRKPGTR